MAEYLYDAWGKILSITDGSGNDVSTNAVHVANANPFRYRGYYYDIETGFYATGTRYYCCGQSYWKASSGSGGTIRIFND